VDETGPLVVEKGKKRAHTSPVPPARYPPSLPPSLLTARTSAPWPRWPEPASSSPDPREGNSAKWSAPDAREGGGEGGREGGREGGMDRCRHGTAS
jgi:hypothetical protein